jgi:sigma-B regulation protein RsbU (phosphoserine phosphatase)
MSAMPTDRFATSSGRALVVDDLAINRKLMRALLQRDGMSADEASDPDGALSAIEANDYDVVLLDLALDEGRSGLELVEALARRPELAPPPVILVTGAACDSDSIERGLRAGAHDYVTRPFSPGELRARVAAARRTRAKEHALRRSVARLGEVAASERAEAEELRELLRPPQHDRPLEWNGRAVGGVAVAADVVSGDLFDTFVDARGRLVVLLLDAAGHGACAALVAEHVRHGLRQRLEGAHDCALEDALKAVQTTLSRRWAVPRALVATSIVRLTRSDFDLENATGRRCGEERIEVVNLAMPPVVIAGARGILGAFESQGAGVGMGRSGAFAPMQTRLPRDASIVLVSDGLVDATGGREGLRCVVDRFGIGARSDLIARASHGALTAMIREHRAATIDAEHDDASLVVVGAANAHAGDEA